MVVKKSKVLWKIPFSFFFHEISSFNRNDSKLPIPKILKGQTSDVFYS